MKQFFAFPSIEQFRNIVREVKQHHDYKGKDETGKAVYQNSSVYPSLRFIGTVKSHGTNASIVSEKPFDFYCQSRNNIIDPVKDNAGFACWVHANRDEMNRWLNWIRAELQVNDQYKVVVYGEWCGGNIQKGVGITGLEKMFLVFGIKVIDQDGNHTWINYLTVDALATECDIDNVYSICKFGTYELVIDFNRPEDVQNILGKITEDVEAECPIAKYFGVSGIGEGVVWHGEDSHGKHYTFKVKGEKHSNSKVKTLAAVDVERVASIKECAEKVCTENRMNQGRDWIINQEGLDASRPENLGAFLKWLNGDIFKEEMDTIVDSGLSPKEVSKEINRIGREFYFRSM